MANSINVVLTGVPRSGTTLTCHLLNKLPDTVALHEPMRGKHVAGHNNHRERCDTIQRFFADQRASILTRGRAASRNSGGEIPDNPFGEAQPETGLRRHLDSKGEITVDKRLTPEFTLVIKHIASFTAMLSELVQWFPVYAVVRNPLAVLASWSTLDAVLRDGHVGPAELLDADLRHRLAALSDPLDRQICLLGWFFEQYHRYLPNRSVIRYETLVTSGGRALSVVRAEAMDLDEPLSSRNANDLYDPDSMRRAGERLLTSDGAFWEFYSRESVEHLLAEFGARIADH